MGNNGCRTLKSYGATVGIERRFMKEIKCTDVQSLADQIFIISQHYSQRNQLEKAKEELHELLAELDAANIPNRKQDNVILPGNTWSEIADVVIMCFQLGYQHDAISKIFQQIEYKLERQFRRMENE